MDITIPIFYVIGSLATEAFLPNYLIPNDIDLIGGKEDFEKLLESLGNDITKVDYKYYNSFLYKIRASSKKYKQIECEIIREGSSSELIVAEVSRLSISLSLFEGFRCLVVSPQVQIAIKRAHINYPINFDKHIKQYHWLLENYGEDINRLDRDSLERLETITSLRRLETERHFGRLRTPAVNTAKKASFFEDSINKIRVFEHDEIHRIMAIVENRPAYSLMQMDNSSVSCSKELWGKMSFLEKCYCVLEEAAVIALERLIIPNIFIGKFYKSQEEAFRWATMRICTTLCGGWFRAFAVENYPRILELAKSVWGTDYVNFFLTKYENGEITHNDTYKKYIA